MMKTTVNMVPGPRIELGTQGFSVLRSTDELARLCFVKLLYQLGWSFSSVANCSIFQYTKGSMRLLNQQTGLCVISFVRIARFHKRLIGLLGTHQILENQALIIPRCQQVHTFFMLYPLGIVALDVHNTVLEAAVLKPWRMSSRMPLTKTIVECHPSHIEHGDIKKDDVLLLV